MRDLFKNLRPDIAFVDASAIHTWELTICHETNFTSSELYKQNKYRLLENDVSSVAGNRTVINRTIEVSTLDLVSDTSDFTSANQLTAVPPSLLRSVACQALDSSFGIYCTRNNNDPIKS